MCLKQASKSLQNIKETLQAYAVARPCIRFSLKVLGAKNDKANWSYAPKKNATMADAALCIFGRAVSSQCTPYPPLNGRGERSPPLTMSHDELSESVETEFKIEAYLPRPGSEAAKVSGKGQFVSVDSRPVSCDKGTIKQLIARYKLYIRSSLSDKAETPIKNPFLTLNISCPTASYDPNIEPTKDDVLFQEPRELLHAAERCFVSVYGELSKNELEIGAPKPNKAQNSNAFELLLARRRPVSTPKMRAEETSAPTRLASETGLPATARSKEGFGPDLEHRSPTKPDAVSEPEEESDDGLFVGQDATDQQPRTWRSTMFGDEEDCLREDPRQRQVTEAPAIPKIAYQVIEGLISPIPSSGTAQSEILPQSDDFALRHGRRFALGSHHTISPPRSAPLAAGTSSPTEPYRQNVVEQTPDAEQQQMNRVPDMTAALLQETRPGRLGPSRTPNLTGIAINGAQRGRPTGGFVSASSLPLEGFGREDQPPQRQAAGMTSLDRGGTNTENSYSKPAKGTSSARSSLGAALGQSRASTRLSGNRDIRSVLGDSDFRTPNEPVGLGTIAVATDESPDTSSLRHSPDGLLDYERRRQVAKKARPHGSAQSEIGFASQGHPDRSNATNLPHQNRYKAAVEVLSQVARTDTSNKSNEAPSNLQADDPRRYLLRTRNANKTQTGPLKPKISKMPLERSREIEWLQNLEIPLSVSVASIGKECQNAVAVDEYSRRKSPSIPSAFSSRDGWEYVTRRMKLLIEGTFRTGDSEVATLALDLRSAVQDHARVYSR